VERLLTVDGSVVVLRKGTVPVAILAENNGGDTSGPPGDVEVNFHLAQTPDGGVE
jgi:hypothetical protein